MTSTWIVYKAENMDAPGWESRKLLPGGGLTDILWEEWRSSGIMPAIGDRVREYTNPNDPNNGITHGRDGDWVVSRLHQFSSLDTDQLIVVCFCEYQPIDSEWEELNQGRPVDQMLEVATNA
ncbi:MAG: hypothetical protein F6J89_16000 [Symploca sp. SIO1C4]|uniref:Uncharacterized protein n=1 Tax=Symploca sp. SIO1C4 TaxID=2607765 RepID=A0A6B3NBX7_9CYAN|nr:hypothetical protein [Symploca sp. SIO1C4]